MSKAACCSSGRTNMADLSSSELADSESRCQSACFFAKSNFAENLRTWIWSAVCCAFLCTTAPPFCLSQAEKPSKDPELISVFPPGGQPGTSFEVEIRGKTLAGASALTCVPEASSCEGVGLRGTITRVEPIASDHTHDTDAPGKKVTPDSRVFMQMQVDRAARMGINYIRLVSSEGISTALPFSVTSGRVTDETLSPHSSPATAQSVSIPATINGRISEPGELDYYAFQVSKDQELSFEVTYSSGRLDAQLALYEQRGSWFDPQHAIRIAFADDPVSSFIDTKPRLDYRFSKDGRYLVTVGSFLGQGGADSVYQLRVTPDVRRPPVQVESEYVQLTGSEWQEQSFRRRIPSNWLRDLAARSGTEQTKVSEPIRRIAFKSSASRTGSDFPFVTERKLNGTPAEALEVSTPTLIEGTIDRPGDVDCFQFKVAAGQRLAFEIETPQAQPPEFNPLLAVRDPEGHELFTNVYKRLTRQDTFFEKSIEPKTLYTFAHEGEYRLEVRDITSLHGKANFRYRLLVRPQIPHVGEISLKQEQLNLTAGESKTLTVTAAEEEGLSGDIAISCEGLPDAVEALPLTQVEPPGVTRGRTADEEGPKDRFLPRISTSRILLLAQENAAPTPSPQVVRIVARPIVGGKPGASLLVRSIPLMIVRPQEPKRSARAGDRY
jgi:hypothetical protein